jgi:nitrogen fixation-related uncharacterized protein
MYYLLAVIALLAGTIAGYYFGNKSRQAEDEKRLAEVTKHSDTVIKKRRRTHPSRR